MIRHLLEYIKINAKKNAALIIVLYFSMANLNSQTFYVNSFFSFKKVDNCQLNPTSYCNQVGAQAIFKDTLYFYNVGNGIYKVHLNGTGCQFLTNQMPGGSSLTVDSIGNLYSENNGTLYKYNPYTNIIYNSGNLPFSNAGDLIFYNGKLLATVSPNLIYEVPINNTLGSTVYMNTNNRFFVGLAASTNYVNNIKYYGLENIFNTGNNVTNVVEIDLENKVILNIICTIPEYIVDAASPVENGINIKFDFTSIELTRPCLPQTTGTIKAIADANINFPFVYVLNNQDTNTTGIFNNVPLGQHLISIKSADGLYKKDTLITMNLKEKTSFNSIVKNPFCLPNNGSLVLVPNVNVINPTFSINGNPYSSQTIYTNLSGGTYLISAIGNNTCKKDSSIFITPYVLDTIKKSITILPSSCENAASGQIEIKITGNQYTYYIKNGGQTYTNTCNLYGLKTGDYSFVIFNKDLCFVDSFLLNVPFKNSLICDAIFIPTAFTPNNDNNNDFFIPKIGPNNKNVELIIMNRYGIKVYGNKNNTTNWNGYYKGKLQPSGTYIYYIKYVSIKNEKKMLKGTLQLIY